MEAVNRTLHILALGLWFGTLVFFTLSGVVIFKTFEELSRRPERDPNAQADEDKVRPLWLPIPEPYKRQPAGRFPDPIRLEQGSRVAGAVVSGLFPWYYGIQLGAGIVALLTALTLSGSAPSRLHRVRIGVLVLAVLTVGVGWGLEQYVSALRIPRNKETDAVLKSAEPTPEQIQAAETARAQFGFWHGISLLQNFTSLALVTLATALAAHLPQRQAASDPVCKQAVADPTVA